MPVEKFFDANLHVNGTHALSIAAAPEPEENACIIHSKSIDGIARLIVTDSNGDTTQLSKNTDELNDKITALEARILALESALS